jgi:hypothetical protein
MRVGISLLEIDTVYNKQNGPNFSRDHFSWERIIDYCVISNRCFARVWDLKQFL